MLQTLARVDDVQSILSGYGQVIVDECHHVPAVSFEAVMKHCSSVFVLGLTATPKRKDGLEKLLFHQCGPVRHEVFAAEDNQLSKVVEISETGFRLPDHIGERPPYHIVADLIASDDSRNALIVSDLVELIKAGRFPIVIADRKDQLKRLVALVQDWHQGSGQSLGNFRLFEFSGSLSPKVRRETLEQMIQARLGGAACVLFATASLVGEGVDLPELDALILASPLSFEGRLIQYVGRLHRLAEGKNDVVVRDYIDASWAVSVSMYRNRIKAYKKMGYEVREPQSINGTARSFQDSLFS